MFYSGAMVATIGLSTLGIFSVLSMTYVYALRGKERYQSLSEYIRKGWPIATPINCILYLFTKKRVAMPIIGVDQFPELKKVQENWETIRDEVIAIKEQGYFDKVTDQSNDSYYDIGFRTFYKYGWSKFYINWYGETHRSAARLCPKTVEILKDIKCVNGAMFSILPVGSKLTRHLDPVACSFRYHLGLKTPNDDRCFINVDGVNYSWRDGEDFIFDETYLHYANNNSEEERIILMCDIDRPLSPIGSFFNWIFKGILSLSVVPNTPEDRKGLFNRIFSFVTPTLHKVRTLKSSNLALYKAIKYAVNFTLFLILVGIVYGILSLF
jgi:beta-hydroxylase